MEAQPLSTPPPPREQALILARALPFADFLAPQIELFWELSTLMPTLEATARAQWQPRLEIVVRNGKFLEELEEFDEELGLGEIGESQDERRAGSQEWKDFVTHALVPQLDALGQWASDCDDIAMRETFLRLLFVRFGAALQARGIASLVRVVPARDVFDATIHKAQGAAPGPRGVVMKLLRVGLRDAKTGALLQPAEVLVGE